MKKLFRILYTAFFTILVSTGYVYGGNIILSTYDEASLWSTNVHHANAVEANTSTNTVNVLFNGAALFESSWVQLDAFHILPNGNYIISAGAFTHTLGGLNFAMGDLVEYNPVSNIATLFFDHNLLVTGGARPDIDAVYVRPNGNIILSIFDRASLAGLWFGPDDLVEYNPTTNTAALFFDGSLFEVDPDPDDEESIDAFHLLENGNLIISTYHGAKLGGLLFRDGDLVEYNSSTGGATIFFSEDNFSSTCEDIDAVYIPENGGIIPEPATMVLFALGLGGVGILRKRKSSFRS
jgi:hypothetical protein